MIKKIELQEDMIYALGELADTDAGFIIKAIGRYVREGVLPVYTTREKKSLAFVFTLFRLNIDAQISAAEERSKTNTENARMRVGKKRGSSKRSSPQPSAVIASETETSLTDADSSAEAQIVAEDENPEISFGKDEAVY